MERAAIVTGGGTGIGAAVAKRLARGQTAVAVVGRRIELLRETVDAIEAEDGLAVAIAE